MGVSTDGLLFYGFEVGGSEASEDHLDFLRLHEDHTSEEAKEIFESIQDDGDHEYDDEIDGSPTEALYQLAKTEQWKGLKLENVCSDSCEQLCLTHDDVCWTANRGFPVEIVPCSLACPPEVYAKMKEFCQEFRIPWQEPKWLLASYWG